jgi:protein MpaA
MSITLTPSQSATHRELVARRSIADALAPLGQLATHSPNLIAKHDAHFEADGKTYELPRYLFIGPHGGDEPIRVGIFAGIHGDEPEGVYALVRFIQTLEARPELAAGYCVFIYPVCNHTGFEDNTRHSRTGKDLNREFWNGSAEPEVRLLESELVAHALHGIISLHTDNTSVGFYGYVHGALLTKHLIEPALRASERFVPRDRSDVIDGFSARNGIIHDGFRGVLRAPPAVHPRPFEIILETPKAAPEHSKEAAFVSALLTILSEYRKLMAYARNL